MTTPPPRRIVVVGNGIAGLTACDSLRAAGFDGGLTVVGDERHAPYSRPALSKALLRDGDDDTSHRLPLPTHEATELLGVTAARLDVDRRTVILDDGTDLPYDGLVIATGSRARRLSADPSTAEAVEEFTLRSLDDALLLRRRLAGTPSVVVIGGGVLGMEVASGCLAVGCAVTLVSRDGPMVNQLGPHLSAVFTDAAQRSGLSIMRTGSVRLTTADGRPSVMLDGGVSLEAELVVSAVGDVPNVEWLATSGLLTGGSLVVDSRGRVRPDVVAAGDVAAFPTRRGVRRVPLWTSAIERSKVAAATLVRGNAAAELDFTPYFWTEQFGLNLKASGFLPLDGDPEVLEGEPGLPPALMRWSHNDGSGTAVALNYRIPVPRLRRLSQAASEAALAS